MFNNAPWRVSFLKLINNFPSQELKKLLVLQAYNQQKLQFSPCHHGKHLHQKNNKSTNQKKQQRKINSTLWNVILFGAGDDYKSIYPLSLLHSLEFSLLSYFLKKAGKRPFTKTQVKRGS